MTHESNGKPMRYTNEQIKTNLTEFMEETKQNDLVSVISFCVGYYGYITKQIWTVITGLIRERKIIIKPH